MRRAPGTCLARGWAGFVPRHFVLSACVSPGSRPSAPQVRQLQEDAARLQAAYAGDKADDIQKRENEVLEAWKALLDACEGRRVRLLDTGDKFRFFSMVRDLMLWMEDVIRQIEAQEKPR